MSSYNPLSSNLSFSQNLHSDTSPSSPSSSDSVNTPFKILQLNCHNSFDVTSNALNSDSHFAILVLQEPWINPHTLRMPHYSNWTCILDSNHSPSNYSEKHRTCFFLDKSFASEEIHLIRDGNRILSAIDLVINNEKIQKIRLINLYNPPRTFEGIKILTDWLNQHNDRRIPSFIFMDSNLHHRSWNPPQYNHTHQQSKDLIRSCGRHGFKIVSEKGIPTFMNRRTSSTVIDLTWGNFSAVKFIESCCTSSINFGSDHQAIVLTLNFNPHSVPVTRLSVDLKNVNSVKFCHDLSQCLEKLNNVSLDCSDDIDSFVEELTISFQNSIDRQKRTVNSNDSKFKAWWDKDILSPIIQKRNQARKWMLIAHSVQASDCYRSWQKIFKDKIFELKRNHWRKFLAESKDHQIFQAYKFTKPISSGNIAPLLNENNDLTSDKEEQARLLFKGTSEVPINYKGTASAALLNNSISFACRINDADKASAYEAEVQAINIGLDIINNEAQRNNLQSFKNINIFSDNQATLQVIAKPPMSKSYQSTFIQIFDKLNNLISDFHFSFSLLWCPAHVGIPENEKVDQLAKEATEGNQLFNLERQTRSLSNIQQIVNSRFKFVKKKSPIIRNQISLSNIPIKIFNSLNQLERGLSSTIYQLRAGHSPLNDFLFRIDKIDSPNCIRYGECGLD
ncbi:hypothetical protein PGT21_008075 [Puccinia graminis f. sp. tritici]|uniref:RNase H type-1 domain-containing protein n=1 Tax=Puccinia graminis f. sp. tritici TaxID=56615 RepID=A0A5B0QES8_PUCGR|nr:hypothetical protein PGT21_008075 [Puccinia graminis f. sp. tritici]